jgi:hypothetical protein
MVINMMEIGNFSREMVKVLTISTKHHGKVINMKEIGKMTRNRVKAFIQRLMVKNIEEFGTMIILHGNIIRV